MRTFLLLIVMNSSRRDLDGSILRILNSEAPDSLDQLYEKLGTEVEGIHSVMQA
jgi:hypothetical protein